MLAVPAGAGVLARRLLRRGAHPAPATQPSHAPAPGRHQVHYGKWTF